MTNDGVAGREGEDFKIIDGNYSARQIKVATASRAKKILTMLQGE